MCSTYYVRIYARTYLRIYADRVRKIAIARMRDYVTQDAGYCTRRDSFSPNPR